MKQIKLIIIIFITILSSPSWSETLTIDDLVIRKEIFYQKFTNTPFSGEISGIENGKFMDGIKDGLWTTYYKNGQLKFQGKYEVGKPDGIWETYYENGQLNEKVRFVNNSMDGRFIKYYPTGQISRSETWNNGSREGVLAP